MEHGRDDILAWARAAPVVPAAWFLTPDRAQGIHGAGHIRRVCALACRLMSDLGTPLEMHELVLHAAHWHDIGRTHDGVEPEHGARSVERVLELGLADGLRETERELVFFAMRQHSVGDWHSHDAAAGLAPDVRKRSLEALWLLKDADGLDRVRLGDLDPDRLRCREAFDLVGFAHELYALI